MRFRGFTLIEILIVVLIIGILVAFATFSYRGLRGKVYRTSCRENMRIMHQAAVLCQTERPEFDKGGLSAGTLLELGYLRKKLICPSGGTYAVTNEKGHVRITCFKTLDGADHGFAE